MTIAVGTKICARATGARGVVILGLALAAADCASSSGASGGGAQERWLDSGGARPESPAAGLAAEILAHRPMPRSPLAEEIADVAASPSLRLLRILGQSDMRHPSAMRTAFSRDGRDLVSVGREGDLMTWDVVPRSAKLRVPPCSEPRGKNTAIVVSADGRFVADGSFGGWICIRSISDGAVVRSWQAYTAPIRALAATAAGELVSYGYRERSYDETSRGVLFAQKESGGEARRWRFADGAALGELAVGPARSIHVSADGSRLVALGVDGLLRAWDTSGRALWTRQRPTSGSVALVAGDRRLFVVEEDRILLVDARTGADVGEIGRTNPKPAGDPLRPWKRAPIWSACLLVTPNGFAITSLEDSNELSIWDATAGREVAPVPANGLECTAGPSFSPDATVMAAAGGDRVVLWSSVHPKQLIGGPVRSVAVAADGGRAVALADDGLLHTWDVGSGREVARRSSPRALSVEVSADGRRMLVKLPDGRVGVADVATGAMLWSSDGREAEGSTARLSPDGSKVAVRTISNLSLHDAIARKRLWSLSRPSRRYVGPVAFSPDGRLLMEAEPGAVQSRAVEDGRVVRRLDGALDTWGVAEVSGDGKHLLARAGLGIDVFDLETGKRLRRTSPKESDRLEATPGGLAILTTDRNGQALRLEREVDGVEIGRVVIGKLFGKVTAVAASADGSRLLVGTDRGVVLVFGVAASGPR
jgi:WD40 repeat protein